MAESGLQAPARVRSRRGASVQTRRFVPLRGFAPLVAGLVLWQLLAPADSLNFPPPSRWVEQLVSMGRSGQLLSALGATTGSFVAGLLLATLIGTVLGALVGRWHAADHALGPFFEFLRVIPPAAIVPIFVLFAGYDESMKLATVVFSAAWPVLLQVRATAKQVPPLLIETARSLGFGRAKTFKSFVLPSLVPGIVAGVRLAAPSVLIVVLLVEIITQVPGIGAELSNAQKSYDIAGVYGLTVVSALLAVVVNLLVALVGSLLRRYLPRR